MRLQRHRDEAHGGGGERCRPKPQDATLRPGGREAKCARGLQRGVSLPRAMAAAPAAPISEHEAALYDRQIRLWGLDAQQRCALRGPHRGLPASLTLDTHYRLRSTSVLVIGVKGLSAEIAKNIVLAGAGNVTIVDGAKVTVADLGANFFLREEDVGKPVRVSFGCCDAHSLAAHRGRSPSCPECTP